MKNIIILLFILTYSLVAQNGDRKGHIMTDPIPADQIPPAPVLNEVDSLKSFKVAEGFTLEVVAFDDLIVDPVAIAFDAKGRIWACEMTGYMPDADGDNEERPVGRIVILEDTNKDGRADKRTVFLEKLSLPRAIACTHDGILLGDHEQLYYVKNEGDKAGKMQIVDPDYAKGGHVEAKSNGLLYGLDNWYYNAQCDKKYCFLPLDSPVNSGKEIFRNEEFKIVLAKTEKRGQWGISTDDFGRLYTNTNSTLVYAEYLRPNMLMGNPNIKAKYSRQKPISNRVYPARMTPGINRGYMKKMLDDKGRLINATGACGLTVYRGDNFPNSFYGSVMIPEPCANMMKAVTMTETDGKFKGANPFGESEILASTDERSRLVNAYTAPDGTLYLVDLYRGILQHKKFLTTYLRKQILARGLDKPIGLGRIYRLRWKEKVASLVPDFSRMNSKQLLQWLNHKNGTLRDTARRLIIEKRDLSIVSELNNIIKESSNHLEVIGSLWTLAGLDSVSLQSVENGLKSSNSKVKAQAIAVSKFLPEQGRPVFAKKLVQLAENADYTSALEIAHIAATFAGKDSLTAVNTVLQKHSKMPYIKDVALHGLYERETEYLAHFSSVTDPAFAKELAKANKPPKMISYNRSVLSKADQKLFDEGKALYYGAVACFSCHGNKGQGMPDLGPPLANSEWVTGDDKVLTSIMLFGMQGKITVNKKVYNPPLVMPGLGQAFKDKQFAAIATFVRNAWGNKAKAVSEKSVQQVRTLLKDRNIPFTEAELLKKFK